MSPERLKHLRKNLLGLSETALADRLGMGRASIARMEKGIQSIELRTELALRWIAMNEFSVTWQDDQEEMNI